MVSLFAYLHHLAAFTLVAALAVELVLVRSELSLHVARKLLATDLVFGISASIILVVGFLRVFYFEKGSSYYFHSIPFMVKISIFVVVGLLSIYPTLQFLSWRKSLREGLAPVVPASRIRALQAIIHWELTFVMLIILCAVLMARGVGVVGS